MWTSITAFISAHPYGSSIGAYWVFSAAVSSMPDIDTSSSKGYAWLYKFLHAIAGDVSTAFASKLPPPSPPLPPGVGTATLK